jgi:hypothetical protein
MGNVFGVSYSNQLNQGKLLVYFKENKVFIRYHKFLVLKVQPNLVASLKRCIHADFVVSSKGKNHLTLMRSFLNFHLSALGMSQL